MAIPTSSSCCCSCSFPYSHSFRQHDKFTLPSTSKHLPPLLFPTRANQPFTTEVHSSASSASPILEQASPAVPLLGFSYKVADSEDWVQAQVGNYNKFISELLRNPSTEELAMEFYHKAKQNPGFRPQKSTVKSILKFLVRLKKWDSISLIARDLKEYQVFPDKVTSGRLVGACLRARKFRVVDSLLGAFESWSGGGGDDGKGVVFHVFDAAMRGYNNLHMYSSTIAIYGRMKSAVTSVDPGGYLPIMEAYMKAGNSSKVVELFNELEADGKLDPSPFTTQVYGILVEALGKSGQALRALECFERMAEKGISPSASIYSSLIGSFADARGVEVAERLMGEAEGKGMAKDPAMFMKLVSMYVDKGLVEKNLDVVIKIMQGAKVKVSDCIFCGIINGFSKKRGLRAAAEVYEDLILQGIEPGQVTYASILGVYCRLGLYIRAEEIFAEMTGRGFDKCVVAYSTMVVMYGKTGKLNEAVKLVAKMKERGCEPNVWIYNALIDLHGRDKNVRQVEKVLKEMERKKVAPDRITYTSVINAYSKAREYEKCVEYYWVFRLNGGVTDLAMAGMMVGVLSKISRIDELIKLLQDMKAEGTKLDVRLYTSALNAFRDAGLEIQVKWLQESFDVPRANAKQRPLKVPVLE